jgi:sulfur-oxidizing protein SoxA
MRSGVFKLAATALVGCALSAPVLAQSASDQLKEYRQMLAEGNPAELYEMEGEELWTKPMGPKNAALDKCDLGMGPGVVKGAAAQLPRYFADTDRVQDLESRLMYCMDKLQGIPQAGVINEGFGKGVRKPMEAIVAYIVGQSKGLPINVPATHPKEKAMVAAGEKLFFLESGPFDFSCASCHAAEDQRIRMQDLPNLTEPKGAAAGWGNWPAYRVSNGTFWTMQRRLNDCYRQQRAAFPIFASDATIALSMFMANKATGAGDMNTPGLKR